MSENETTMSNDQIETLVLDTLFANRYIGEECLVVNGASVELRRVGERALPFIENAISEKVAPTAACLADHNALISAFHGILSLWGVYFEIGSDGSLCRVMRFLAQNHGPVLAAAMLATRSVFRTIPKQTSDAIMPAPLRDFIREVAAAGNSNEAEMARLVLKSVFCPAAATSNAQSVA